MRLLLIILCFVSCTLEQHTGTVVKVIDGDTFDLLVEKKTMRVRIFGIDSPERGQAYNVKAKEFTASVIAGKEINVSIHNKDRYGRFVCDVYLSDGTYVNAEIVRAGYAWHFIRYSNDPKLAQAENEARNDKRGLWQDSDPVPPWEFRKR